MEMDPSDLQELLNLRRLSRDAARARYDPDGVYLREGRNYGRAKRLTELYDPDVMPGRMYFSGDQFVLLYIDRPATWSQDTLQSALAGHSYEILASTSGKLSSLYVYPDDGLAFSADVTTGQLDYLEVFPPMPLEEYLSRYYEDPGSFVE